MIRPVDFSDTPSVRDIAVDAGLFDAADADFISAMMTSYFATGINDDHFCLVFDEGLPLGVAYAQPALATSGTWYLTMIGVRPAAQSRGVGTELLREVEAEVGRRFGRLLLVETSGLPSFDATRSFYERLGYTREATVRDYFEAGDDMVLYRKELQR